MMAGRARALLVLAVTLGLCAVAARGAVMGVDLGTKWLKVGVVKPGRGMSIVLNEHAKRKSATVVAFHENERVLGSDALTLATKNPRNVFQDISVLLGAPYNNRTLAYYERGFLPYAFARDDVRNTLRIVSGDQQYSPEELVAMELGYAKHLAEQDLGQNVRECVITVPPYFTQAQRMALLQAAQLAGLRVLNLITSNAAVALSFGMERVFDPKKPETHMFFDMGADGLRVSLVKFSQKRETKPRQRTPVPGELQVLTVAWDRSLGGTRLDERLAQYMAERCAEKGKFPLEELVSNRRSMAKILKHAEKAKIILSANKDTHLFIESVLGDHDYADVITRDEFIALVEPTLRRLLKTVRHVLTASQMTADDVASVLLFGGSTRIPYVQSLLKDVFGREQLAHKLNADEAGAIGATFSAAGLSAAHRVREFKVKDAVARTVRVALADGKSVTLFARNAVFPSVKMLSFQRSEDVEMKLVYDPSGDPVEPAEPEFEVGWDDNLDIAAYIVRGVADLLAGKEYNGTVGKPKMGITYRMAQSGVVELEKAEVTLEETISERVLVEDPAFKKGNKTASKGDTDKERIDRMMDEDEDLTYGAAQEKLAAEKKLAETESTPAPAPQYKNVTRTVTHRYPLKQIDHEVLTTVTPLTDADIAASKKLLRDIEAAALARKQTAEAKNTLESYVYSMRDKLDMNDDVDMVSTEDERTAILAGYADTVEWLYEDGEHADATTYLKRLDAMRDLGGDAILTRVSEMQRRPAASNVTRMLLNTTRQVLDAFAADALTGVGENDRELLAAKCDALEAWLDENEAAQAKQPLTEAPVYTVQALIRKGDAIKTEVERLLRIPRKPTPTPTPTATPAVSTPRPENDTTRGEGESAPAGDVPPAQTPAPEGDGAAAGEREVDVDLGAGGGSGAAEGQDATADAEIAEDVAAEGPEGGATSDTGSDSSPADTGTGTGTGTEGSGGGASGDESGGRDPPPLSDADAEGEGEGGAPEADKGKKWFW